MQHSEPSPPRREPPHREPLRVVRTYSRASRPAQPAPRSLPFDGGTAHKRVHGPGDETRRMYAVTERVRATTLEHY